MKTVICLSLMLMLVCGIALAADINGKYVAEQKITPPGGGEERVVRTTFDLKTAGDVLTGTVTGGGRRGGGEPPPPAEIKEGKVDGSKFSFKTLTPGRDGAEVTTVYEGTVEGDTLKGTRVRQGGQGQPQPFEAKKQ